MKILDAYFKKGGADIRKAFYKDEYVRETLKRFAEGIPLDLNDGIEFALQEAFSRFCCEEILWSMDDTLRPHQNKLKNGFDVDVKSAGTKVIIEQKVRWCGVDTYPTTDITGKKGDFISERKGLLIVFFTVGFDYLIFDLSKDCFVTDGEWTHPKSTAIKSPEVTEDSYKFDPSKAIYRGRLNKDFIKTLFPDG